MKQIELNYDLQLNSEKQIINLALLDQKNIIDHPNEITVKGNILFDILYEDQELQHEEREFEISLNKERFHQKNLELKIQDYSYQQTDKTCQVNLIYEVIGEDAALERFCSLDNPSLENELRDYLNRNGNNIEQLKIDEDKIVILDPVIEEEPIKISEPVEEKVVEPEVEVKNEQVEEKEEVKIEERQPLFAEKYTCSHVFYRVKKDDTIESIAQKFSISVEEIKKCNNHKEFSENTLIQVPKHV